MESVDVQGVDVLRWNPRVPLPLKPQRLMRWTRRLPLASRVGNVGDVLGPEIVRQHLDETVAPRRGRRPRPSLAVVGSVIHMLPGGTVVWGAGVNGKHVELPLPERLDIRAVRGPLTGRHLAAQGIRDPGVYGDPALLLQTDVARAPTPHGVVHVPNLNDFHRPALDDVTTVDPRTPLLPFLRQLARAELVVGSSLHGVILAERLGVPARVIRSDAEPSFKYEDYYEGTGRANVRLAADIHHALDLGGVDSGSTVDATLAAAFPRDLWER
ncbi:polysaccharide pyruvyl transferase family protein [Micrococcus luteus]